MKIFFDTRSEARSFRASSSVADKVVDGKNSPSVTGKRWAVSLSSPKKR